MHNIFANFVDKDGDSRRTAYADWFVETFPITEFAEDELLFYLFIEYCATLGVSCKRQYLEIWCSTDLKPALVSRRVKVKGCEAINMDDPLGFEEIFRTTQQVLLDDFDVLATLDISIEDFPVECAKFMNDRKSERMVAILSTAFDKLQSTNDATVAGEYAAEALDLVNLVYDDGVLDDIAGDTPKTKVKRERVSDYGLPAIDADSDGIWTTQLVDIEAQPGTGKTRYTVGHTSYTAAVKYGKNVLYEELEQDKEEIEAMFVARHVFELYNIQITDSQIVKDTVPEEYKSYVESARIDLFESGKYGKIVIRDDLLYVESLIRTMSMYDKLYGPFDVIAIDYVGLIESKPAMYKRELTQADIISTSLKLLKRYAKKKKKAITTISQFNKEGVQAGEADKKITTDMAMGGMSVYRHTDYNIAISMTEEMRAQGRRRFSQPKVRSSAGFGTFIADAWLGVCYFQQEAKKAV